jgi:cell division protein FtsB
LRDDEVRLSARQSFWLPVAIVTLAAVVFGCMLAGRRAEFVTLREQEVALVARLQALRRQNAVLRDERDRLLTDVRAIERVAREQYGFVGPGEISTPFVPPREVSLAPAPLRYSGDAWDRVLGVWSLCWKVPLAVFMVSAAVFAALERVSVGRGSLSIGSRARANGSDARPPQR